jgi:hypothetical protein
MPTNTKKKVGFDFCPILFAFHRYSYKSVCFAGIAGLSLGMSVFSHPTCVTFIPGFATSYIFYSMPSGKK